MSSPHASGASAEFNIGIDLESSARFRAMPPASLGDLFVDEEISMCRRFADPAACLTATWCAKEAVVKAAWPWVQLDPRSVLIERRGARTRARILGREGRKPDLEVQVTTTGGDGLALATAFARIARVR